MPSLRDHQHTLLHTTVHTAALALLAGSMASVTLAQDGKDAKDPKASQPLAPPPAPAAKPTARPAQPTVQPTARDGKTPAPAAANPKGGQPTPHTPASPKDAPAGKANPTPPAAG